MKEYIGRAYGCDAYLDDNQLIFNLPDNDALNRLTSAFGSYFLTPTEYNYCERCDNKNNSNKCKECIVMLDPIMFPNSRK